MKYLDKKQLKELDEKIDSRIQTFKFLKQPKDQAIYCVLLYFDLWMNELGKDMNLDRRKNLYRHSYQGLDHLVRWIYNFCPRITVGIDKFANRKEEVSEIFHEAIEYSTLWVQMSMLWKNRSKCQTIESNHYEISLASLRDEEYESARQILANTKRHPKNPEDASNINFQNRNYVKNKIKIKQISADSIKYSFSPESYSLLISAISQRSLLEWQMNQDWDLGGYTFKQLKTFWLTLQTLCAIHEIAIDLVKNPKKREIFQIRIMSNNEWINYISQWSKLSQKIVGQIINDLTFDEKLYQSRESKPHVMYQPFFQFENGDLGVSNKIVQISNIERNIWSLLLMIRPETHSTLRNLKEKFWIQEFQENIKPKELECFSNINYKSNNEQGNVDLLLIDKRMKFGLICELKWLTPTDDVKGTKYADDQIITGVGQAERGLKWILNNINHLAERINYKVDELKKFEFKSLVICKDTLLSGFVEKPRVPVINEQLFDWIINIPHHKDLINVSIG